MRIALPKAFILAIVTAFILSLGGCAVYGGPGPGYYEAQPGYAYPYSGSYGYFGYYGDYDHEDHDRGHYNGGHHDFDEHSYYHGHGHDHDSYHGHGGHGHHGDGDRD